MTLQRILLGAHQREAMAFHALPDTVKSLPKKIRLGEAVVLDFSMEVARLILALRSQFLAEENIDNTIVSQRLFEVLAVELRIHAAIRARPYIAERRYAVLLQKGDEAVHRVSGVSDRENIFTHKLSSQKGCLLMTVATSL
jgi:hypothetical protein